MTDTSRLIVELAKAKALFQQRAIIAAMGMEHPQEQCATIGSAGSVMLTKREKRPYDRHEHERFYDNRAGT